MGLKGSTFAVFLPQREVDFSFFTNKGPEEEDVEQSKKDYSVLVNRIHGGKKRLIAGLTFLNNLALNEEGMFESPSKRVFCTYKEAAYAIKESLHEGVICFNDRCYYSTLEETKISERVRRKKSWRTEKSSKTRMRMRRMRMSMKRSTGTMLSKKRNCLKSC